MANFPKTYQAPSDTYAAHTIHTSGGAAIWGNSDGVNSEAFNNFDESESGTFASPGSGVIDIYNFSEGAGAGQTAYALLIIKNTGSAGSSFVFPTSNSLGLSVNGVDFGNDATDTGFSIVDTIADATVNSIPRIISQADFTGAKDEGTQASYTSDSKIFFKATNFGTVHEQITINFVHDASVNDACNITVANNYDVTLTVEVGVTQLSTVISALGASNPATGFLTGNLVDGVSGSGTVTQAMVDAATANLACATLTGLTSGNGYAEPLGYFPVRDNTYSGGVLTGNLSLEIFAGYQTETHAGNVNPDTLQFKYVPIYTPAQLNTHTVQNTGGVPHYCGILIKFESESALTTTIDDNVFLNINVINAEDASIQLTGNVTASADLFLQYGTAGAAIDTGVQFDNITTVSSVTVLGDQDPSSVIATEVLDSLDDMGRMRFYPVALAAGNATEPLEYIRISNNAASSSALSYFPGQFAQLGNISGVNNISSTNFHTTISTVSNSTIGPDSILEVGDGSGTQLSVDTDGTANTISNGDVLWTFGVDNTVLGDQQQISLSDEHYLQLVRSSQIFELLPFHDFYHPEDVVSASYASTENNYAPIDNYNFRPFVIRHSYKWYPFYIDSVNNSGLTTTVAAIAYANYFPWTPSQELLARFKGHFFSTVSGPMYRNDTYRRAPLVENLFGNAQIPTDGSFEFDNNEVTHKSIINASNKTDLNNQQVIQPCAHDLNIMARNAFDDHTGQPYYDLMMEWNFNMMEPDPSEAFIGGTGSDNLFCSTFNWTSGEIKDSNGELTGRFFLTGDETNSYERHAAYSSSAGGADNILGANSQRMAVANKAAFSDLSAVQFPNGSVKRDVYFELRFTPKDHFNYSFGQPTHSQTKVDYIGRNIYKTELFVTGGTDAVHFVASDTADKEDILDTTRYPSLKFNALSWRHDPELYLVTSNSNSLTVLSGPNINGHPTGCSVVTVDYNTANVTNNSWFKPDEAAKDETDYPNPTQTQTHGFTSVSMDLESTALLANLSNGTNAVYETDLSAAHSYAFNGSSVIRSTNAANSGSANLYEMKPRKNIVRHPSNASYVKAWKNWPFFIQADTKLNSTYNRYEAYIPLNFAAKGDSAIRIIDITLAQHTGNYNFSTNTWTYEALPANGSAGAKKMAPCKPFKTHTEYNNDVSAAYSCADFVTQSSGADVADAAFIWEITKNPIASETYGEAGSTVVNKEPYPFTYLYNGHSSETDPITVTSAWTWAAASGDPMHHDIETVKDTIIGDFYGPNTEVVSPHVALPRSTSSWNDIFNEAGTLMPVINADGTTSASPDFFNQLNNSGDATPHIFFAIDKTLTDASGLTEAHFYNRIRVRYVREIKRDVVVTDANNNLANNADGTPADTLSLIPASGIKIYEAWCLVKISFQGQQGILTVVDAEGDTVANNEHIDFGTINV